MTDAPAKGAHGYRIGAVARLTGVPADTLRVWERRYAVAAPVRAASGSRVYAGEDVARLTLIKRLVDRGDAISRVAPLSLDELRQRLRGEGLRGGVEDKPRSCRLVALGGLLTDRLGQAGSGADGVEVVGVFRERRALAEGAAALSPDLLVVEAPTLYAEQVQEIGTLLAQSGAQRAVVVYNFASRATLARFDSRRVALWRAPVEPSELRRWCAATSVGAAQGVAGDGEGTEVDVARPIPERRFDDEALARIMAASTTVRCECPHHLADLVANLLAFEAYSRECESRSPEDAALHAYLHASTAHCRALIEAALARVIAAEGNAA
jgi:MerR family transcriptional regulator, light-induced transcriptional regulator